MQSISSSYITNTYASIGLSTSPDVTDSNDKTTTPVQPLTDSIAVSREGRQLSGRAGSSDSSSENTDTSQNNLASTKNSSTEKLSYNETTTLRKLQARDREVRSHEQAHLAAAGQYARGGASFDFQRGADGRTYAVGGEVSIDIGRENSPEATIAKMQTVKRAALAPASPSAADRQIAAQATVKLAQAQQELQQGRLDTNKTGADDGSEEEPVVDSTINSSSSLSNGSTSNTRILMIEAYKAVDEFL